MTTTVDNSNLVAYKALVSDQVLRLCSEDELCGSAITRSNRALGLNIDEAYDTHVVDIPFKGTLRIAMPGYGADQARQRVINTLRHGNTLSMSVVDYNPDEMTAPTLPEGADTDPDVIAYKERIRAFVADQVDRRNVDRRTVNPRLVNIGIAPLDGPKEYQYLIQVNPTTVARYNFVAVGEEAAQAELARLIQQDKDRGYIDPARLRISMPDEIPTPVLAQEPTDV
jgi:hypothetical protein